MRFVIRGKVKPAVRMTRRGKWISTESLEYYAWKLDAGYQLKRQALEAKPAAATLPLFKRGIPLVVDIEVELPSGLHKADVDNIAKALLDAANGILWHDDRWVDDLRIVRRIGGGGGVCDDAGCEGAGGGMTVKIIVGDCRKVLKELPAESVHCVVSSPPYWGLRDYGTEPLVWGGEEDCQHIWGKQLSGRRRDQQRLDELGERLGCGGGHKESNANHGYETSSQFCRRCNAWRGSLGLEPTVELYVEHLVSIFREVKRVLRDDGTVWLNMGDCYASQGGYRDYGSHDGGTGRKYNSGMRESGSGLKPKDLCGIPWRVAFALQADGWWLRSDIIWAKTNPMPESVTDRCTKSHEYVFMLTKNRTYYFDQDAIREPQSANSHGGIGANPGSKIHQVNILGEKTTLGQTCERLGQTGRNRRTVWTISTKPFPGAHFAVFPEALVTPCIKAGSSGRGACGECGGPWKRMVERTPSKKEMQNRSGAYDKGAGKGQRGAVATWSGQEFNKFKAENPDRFIGWQPTCDCDAGDPVPAVVLDPLAGAGTVGLVALKLGRDAIIIELKPTYAEMARQRIERELGTMFTDVQVIETQGSVQKVQAI